MIKLYDKFKFMVVGTMILSSISLTACQSLLVKGDRIGLPSMATQRNVPSIIMGDEQVLVISPERMACNSELPMQCIVVSTTEAKLSNSVFQLPYDAIEGFTAKANMTYKISARPLIDKNNNQATGRWQLQSILSQRPVRVKKFN